MLHRILAQRNDNPPREPLGARCLEYARAHAVPEAWIERLAAFAYAAPIRFGPVFLSRLAELDLANGEEENRPCLEHGFLVVGSGLNGDPVAVELATGKMVFLAHDLLWERDYERFEECVVRTPLGFEEFFAEAGEGTDFPRDSYDARNRWHPEEA